MIIMKRCAMKKLEERIYDVIKNPHLAGLASITEDGKPWVRYVLPVGNKDLTLRFSTFTDARKVSQMKNNPEVHINCGVTDILDPKPYIQYQGRALISTDPEEKKNFWNPGLEHIFSGPEDPNYAVVIVTPYCIEYNLPNSLEAPEIWTSA